MTELLNAVDGKKTATIAGLFFLAGLGYFFEMLTVEQLGAAYAVLLGPLIYALRDALRKSEPIVYETATATLDAMQVKPPDPAELAVLVAATIDKMKKPSGGGTAPATKGGK